MAIYSLTQFIFLQILPFCLPSFHTFTPSYPLTFRLFLWSKIEDFIQLRLVVYKTEFDLTYFNYLIILLIGCRLVKTYYHKPSIRLLDLILSLRKKVKNILKILHPEAKQNEDW